VGDLADASAQTFQECCTLKADLRPVDSVCRSKLQAAGKTLGEVGFVQTHHRGHASPRLHRGEVASITIGTQDGEKERFESGNRHAVTILRNRCGEKRRSTGRRRGSRRGLPYLRPADTSRNHGFHRIPDTLLRVRQIDLARVTKVEDPLDCLGQQEASTRCRLLELGGIRIGSVCGTAPKPIYPSEFCTYVSVRQKVGQHRLAV
jgi:hypothetical protein